MRVFGRCRVLANLHKCIITLQSPNKLLKILSHERYLVIEFLIDMDDLWFTASTTLPIIEADHIMSSGWTITKVDTDGRVSPFIYPELTAKATA